MRPSTERAKEQLDMDMFYKTLHIIYLTWTSLLPHQHIHTATSTSRLRHSLGTSQLELHVRLDEAYEANSKKCEYIMHSFLL